MKLLRTVALFAFLSVGNSALADLIRTFDSYHAFFIYADDGANTNTFRNDALAMMGFFDNFTTPWSTTLYGVNEGTSLLDAMNDMKDPIVAAPDELIFFYYSGHGGGTDAGSGQAQPGTGVADANGDESNTEDPPPPGYETDTTDETLAFGPNPNDFVLDDVFGDLTETIQMQGAFVSGAIDSCHANGMLDGSRDIRGFVDRESAWMTSATEWEPAPIACGSGFGTIVDRLKRELPTDVDQIGDLQDWFLEGAAIGGAGSTIGVKMYEDLEGTKRYFATAVPEPTSLALLGAVLLAGFAARLRHIASTKWGKGRYLAMETLLHPVQQQAAA